MPYAPSGPSIEQHVHHRVPVTGLAHFDAKHVLAAYGNHLAVFDIVTKVRRISTKIFDDQAIHGILIDALLGTVIVWGGCWLASAQVVVSNDIVIGVSVLHTIKTDDWIFDVSLSPVRDDLQYLVAITAHNALLAINARDLSDSTATLSCLDQPVVPGSNCLLYTALVSWFDHITSLVASGTAFGDVIVWSAKLEWSGSEITANTRIHYTFSAHEGSIFGVQICPQISLGPTHIGRRVLATCSDDRMICLWDITDFEAQTYQEQQEPRETGFVSKQNLSRDGPPRLAAQMGHLSRIWQVHFLPPENFSETISYLMSFGEDASNITWSVCPSPDTKVSESPFTLKQVAIQRAHAGKHIWSTCVTRARPLLTGGADGAIIMHDLSLALDRTFEIRFGLANQEKAEGEFRSIAFLSRQVLIVVTQAGRVLRLDFRGELDPAIEWASQPIAGLKGYSLVAHINEHVFVSGNDGTIYLVTSQPPHVTIVGREAGKTAGLFATSSGLGEYTDELLLVTAIKSSTARLYRVPSGLDFASANVMTDQKLVLPNGFAVTSFAACNIGDAVFLVLGSRYHGLAIYAWNQDSELLPGLDPITVVANVHGAEAITSLCWVEQHLWSTGRDGVFAVHRLIPRSDDSVVLRTVHQLTVPFGSFVESSLLCENGHVWIWGFRSKHFVVYDVTTQSEIMAVQCGGGHRTWAFRPSSVGGHFIWTQASKHYHSRQDVLPFESINSGGHGREIKATAILDHSSQLIATGAEDTDIKIHSFESDKGLHCLCTIRKHVTGIQQLQWLQGGSNRPESLHLFSSGGFEEFYIWRITRNVPHIGIGYVCETAHPRNSTSDLRIMNFDATRLDGDDSGAADFHVRMVYSDSTIKEWTFQNGRWRLLAQGEYTAACLTQLTHLRASNMILTASTDGHVAFWPCVTNTTTTNSTPSTSSLTWQDRWQIHQNSILALEGITLQDESVLLVTGGDDNAVCLTRIAANLDGRELARIHRRTVSIPRAHAAAVTGLVVFHLCDATPSSFTSRVRVVSVSIDQRVKVWDVTIDERCDGATGISVELCANVPTAVADASGMSMMRRGDGSDRVLITGVGMDVWDVEHPT